MEEPIEVSKDFQNLGTRRIAKLREANFPDADPMVRDGIAGEQRSPDAVDILLVNPPSPDGGIWIRTQHHVGRRSREEMVWPQCSLAQHAAMLQAMCRGAAEEAETIRRNGLRSARLSLEKYQHFIL